MPPICKASMLYYGSQYGSILALAGVKHDTGTGEISADALYITNVFVPVLSSRRLPLTAGWQYGAISNHPGRSTDSFCGFYPINSGLRPMVHVLLQRWRLWNIRLIPIWSVVALNMLGTPYSPGNMALGTNNVDASMKNLLRLLQNMA